MRTTSCTTWVFLPLIFAACGRIGFDSLGGSADGNATGDGAAVVSCAGLAPTCGRAGSSPCCDSLLVPGGTYLRSYDVAIDMTFNDMMDPATVSDFRLDTFEVTVGRFRQFVTAGMGTQQAPPPTGEGARMLNGMASQGGWDPSWTSSLAADPTSFGAALKCNAMSQTWTDTPAANEALPINCVTWYEAFAFCAWDGGFLPTEAEWNYAAVGGAEQRAYPWSNPPASLVVDCAHANYYDSGAGISCVANSVQNRVGSESPLGDGKWGQADLGGNASEWTLDWEQVPYPNPCNDCADLTVSSAKIVRGGDSFNYQFNLRGASRSGVYPPASRSAAVGVRCARSP